ncbi:MAG: methyltransferase [Bacteroidia bacterium]|nr:MAG: methyltransferase [Bacteroidia bacterium]
MKDFWNERFADKDYIYGTRPNEFLKQELLKLSLGKILFPAEGEGRNAVFAAQVGWEVYCYDFSENGKQKAVLLAEKNKVKIHYDIFDHNSAIYPFDFFDAVSLIYAHTKEHSLLHQKALNWLKSGGTLILEAFSKEQLNYNSGGPKDPGMLYSVDELNSDFSNCHEKRIWQEEIELSEGNYHQGRASVIRAIIKK